MASVALRIGIVGLGHWGPNYVRIFSAMEGVQVKGGADPEEARCAALRAHYPDIQWTLASSDILQDPEVDAVVLATPTHTHAALVQEALEAGKHVLVEKPLALRWEDAKRLDELARTRRRVLMVGHTFLFNPGIQTMKRLLQAGELGPLYYLNLVRTHLGPIRQDVNALMDLAPHDIAILLYLLESFPTSVSAQGAAFLNPPLEDVAYLTLRFPRNILAQIHVSWVEPIKVRQVTAIGGNKMALFDDLQPEAPVKIFDKGVHFGARQYNNFEEFQVVIRDGPATLAPVPRQEPLRNQCEAFVQSLRESRAPVSDGAFGAQVVQILEAAMTSLREGRSVAISK